MSQALPDLSSTLGYQLKKTADLLRRQMDQALATCDLTTPQYACLVLLTHKPQHNAELARDMFLSRQTTNLVLQGLKARGLICSDGQPGSRREQRLQITPAGRALLDQAIPLVTQLEQLLENDLSATQKSELLTRLLVWQQALDQAGEAPIQS